jgi:hypothetical protein
MCARIMRIAERKILDSITKSKVQAQARPLSRAASLLLLLLFFSPLPLHLLLLLSPFPPAPQQQQVSHEAAILMAQEMMDRAMQTAQLQRRLIVAAGACF